jgi:purine nucleosidase
MIEPGRTVSAFATLVLLAFGATAEPIRVIVDTDPGTDDAMAILLALRSPELRVEALTLVAGNVDVEQGLRNAQGLASLAGRCDVPVARGAAHPLAQRLITATYWHGANGLGGVDLPPGRCPLDPRPAADLIVEMIRSHPHEVTLVAIGPLTNIALALKKDPEIAVLAKGIVMMGGSVSGGNVTAAAEFNVYNDPEAAAAVFRAGWTVTMIGSDVGERTLLTAADLAALPPGPDPVVRIIEPIARQQVERSVKAGYGGAALYDPLAVAAVIDPTLVTFESWHVDVETRGEFTRGETVANRMGSVERHVAQGDHDEVAGVTPVEANARVAVAADARKLVALLLQRWTRAPRSP